MVVTVIPVLFAMLIRHSWPKTIIKIEPVFRKIMGLLFILLILMLLVVQWPKLQSLGGLVVFLCLALCVVAMIASFLIARAQGFKLRIQKTLAIEVGIQNAGTGIFIAAVLLNNTEIALIPLAYGLLMNIPAVLLIVLSRRGNI